MNTPSLHQYLDTIRTRLSDPEIKHRLQFGSCDPKFTAPLRDERGYEETCSTILTSAANMFQVCKGKDAVANMITNFSDNAGVGYVDVANVNTVGAIDLTILAYAESLIPYVCVDRGLATPDATVYFQDLVATNNAGGVTAGTVVNGSYQPANMQVDLGLPVQSLNGGSETNPEFNFTSQIIPRSIVVTVTDGSTTFAGKDFEGNGTIYFNGIATKANADYATGKIVVTGIPSGFTSAAQVQIDSTKDTSGSGILRVAPRYTSIQLKSSPQNIILDNNMADIMYMNKQYTLATGGANAPYNDSLFQRLKNTYIEYINKRVILAMLRNLNPTADIQLNLSDYALDSFSYTKNDIIAQVISNMGAVLLKNSGVGMTALLTNSYGAALLMNIPVLFVATPDANKGLNGLIGYWQGTPVYRHNALDTAFSSIGYAPGTKAEFIGCYRSADNQSGSQIYGEFLPFTATGAVSNYNNPIQVANGYFSQVANTIVGTNLTVRAEVITPTGIFPGARA